MAEEWNIWIQELVVEYLFAEGVMRSNLLKKKTVNKNTIKTFTGPISKYFLQSLQQWYSFGYLMERLLRESWCRNRVDNSWPNRYRSEINTVHTFGKPSGQSPSSIRIRTAVIYPATVNNVKQYRDLGVLPLRIAVEAANGWKEIYKRIARLDQVSV